MGRSIPKHIPLGPQPPTPPIPPRPHFRALRTTVGIPLIAYVAEIGGAYMGSPILYQYQRLRNRIGTSRGRWGEMQRCAPHSAIAYRCRAIFDNQNFTVPSDRRN